MSRKIKKIPDKFGYTLEQLKSAVANNFSQRQTLIELGKHPVGRNRLNLLESVKLHDVCTEHFTGRGYLKGKTHNWAKKGTRSELVLGENSTVPSARLKKSLLEFGIIDNQCSMCGISKWRGNELCIELDHINGKSNDDRIENLRMLCPNCHSQTDTFKGKNRGKHKLAKQCKCGKSISPRSKRCQECHNRKDSK